MAVRSALWATWVVLLALVTGCANTAATRSAKGLELDLAAGPDEGFVAVRVVALRPVSSLNPKWQSIEIASASVKRAELQDITPPSNVFFFGKFFPTESLYFAKLKAGTYDVTGFGSVGPGPGLLLALMASDRSAGAAKLPSFTVQGGRLANLGTIVYAPPIEDKVGGNVKEQLFLLRGPLGQGAALATLQAESNRTDVPLAQGGGWTTAPAPDEEQRQLALARDQALMLYTRDSQAGVVAGTHLGQFYVRTGPRRMDRQVIDTLGTIFTANRTADGRWVAGGEYGTYYVKEGEGRWQARRLPGDAGRVVYIEPRGPDGVLLVTTAMMQSRFWAVEHVAAAEQPKEVAKVAAPPDLILSTPTQWILPRNIPGISRETELVSVQKADFSMRTQMEKFWVSSWQALPNGDVMLTRQNAMSAYAGRSRDGGKTWELSDKAGGLSTFWLDGQRAYNLDWKPGFSTVENHLQKTTDGGASFQRIGTPMETPGFAGRIVHADPSEVLLQGGNMLFSTTDEGKTWLRLMPPRAQSPR